MTLVLAVLAVAFALWRHWPRVEQRLRLAEMMRLQRVSPARPRDHAAAQDAATAERRCAACASKELCDELLRGGDARQFRKFCPNALYIEWLRSNSLHFD
jgi:hypothetical protein